MSQSLKKKLMALMVVGVMAIPMVSFAGETAVPTSENEVVAINTKEQMESKYIQYAGEILEVMEREGNVSIHVNSGADEYGMVFHVSDDVSLWDRDTEKPVKAKDLKKGMAVQVFFSELTPTTMSLPPQLTPGVIVIQSEEVSGSTFVGKFNKELISADNTLKLNIGEDTVIVNEKGEKLTEEDIYNQTALVFYGMSTKSIPAQTTPSKVVVFSKDEVVQDAEEVQYVPEVQESAGIEDADTTIVMTDLRDTLTQIGYKVKWNEGKSIELTKENQTIVIQIGKVDYTLNKSVGKFRKAPELRNGVTYVSTEILEIIE